MSKPTLRAIAALMLPALAAVAASSHACAAAAYPQTPMIAELLADATGSDSGHAFVELFGRPGASLAGLSLVGVNGSTGSDYKTTALEGAIPADGVFVVADDDAGSTAVPNADLLADVDFQNGPDSVQLRDASGVLDAVGYGDFSGGAVFAGEGGAAPAPAAGSSLARLTLADTDDNGADFSVLSAPTPGSVPVSAVPVPPALWLFGSGLGMLMVRRRSPAGGVRRAV
ncbi:MAG TPA: hypothetical protein VKA14_01660 [Gammaproteobacteria bacterium]|nr:hypothetical protein [Gammaproteobacteria bacterium]